MIEKMKLVEKFAARLLGCLTVGLLAVGCSSSATEEPLAPVDPDDAPVEIVLNGGISLAVDPAAPVQASLASDTRAIINPVHDDLQISILRVDATDATPTYPAYSTFSSALNATLYKFVSGSTTPHEMGEIEFATPQFYLANGYKTKLIGWYPQVGTGAKTSQFANGVVTCDIDGDTDIMLSGEQSGDKNAKISSPLAFDHLLTRIQVSAYAETDDAKTVWGKIEKIELKDQGGKKCQITLPSSTGFVAPASASNLKLAANTVDAGTAIVFPLELGVKDASGKNAKECGYAMFEPVAAVAPNPATVTLVVTTEKTTKEVPVKVTGGFLKGTAYSVVLKFTAAGIEPTGSITKWEDHTWGTGEGEIEL